MARKSRGLFWISKLSPLVFVVAALLVFIFGPAPTGLASHTTNNVPLHLAHSLRHQRPRPSCTILFFQSAQTSLTSFRALAGVCCLRMGAATPGLRRQAGVQYTGHITRLSPLSRCHHLPAASHEGQSFWPSS